MAKTRRRKAYRKTKRWNPVRGTLRPRLGQWLLRLGLPVNDPIVEVGAAWAAGVAVDSRLLRQAKISAEHWMENRDRKFARIGKSVHNKLIGLISDQERAEDRGQFKYSASSLTSGVRYANPRQSGDDFNNRQKNPPRKSRRNPYEEDWHVQQMIRAPKLTPKQVARLKRKLAKAGSNRVVKNYLGSMSNPKGRRTGGSRRNKRRATRGNKWEQDVRASLPYWVNPKGRKSRRNPAQFPMPFSTFLNPRRRAHKARRNPAQFPMPFSTFLNPRRC